MKNSVQFISKALLVISIFFSGACKSPLEEALEARAISEKKIAELSKENERLREEQKKREEELKNKADLDREIQRVAPILQGLANNPDQLAKTIEELTRHGKAINQALQGNSIGYNLLVDSNDALTNTDVAVLVNHPRLPKMVKFNLDCLQLSKPQLKRLLNVGRLAELQYLRFRTNLLLTIAPSLKLLPNLMYLDLSYCGLGDIGMRALAPCFNGITYLVGLDLSNNNFGPIGAQALADHCKDLPNLRGLKLDGNMMELKGIQALAPQLMHLAKLRGLGLAHTFFRAGHAGVKALAPYLKDLPPRLGILKLEGNKLGDEGIKNLIPILHNLPRLNYLGLADNCISGVGAKLLVEYLNIAKKVKSGRVNTEVFNRQIAQKRMYTEDSNPFSLYLGHNQIDDVGARAFLDLSPYIKSGYIYLESLNSNYLISDEMVKELQKLCYIAWEITTTSYSAPYLDAESFKADKERILENDWSF